MWDLNLVHFFLCTKFVEFDKIKFCLFVTNLTIDEITAIFITEIKIGCTIKAYGTRWSIFELSLKSKKIIRYAKFVVNRSFLLRIILRTSSHIDILVANYIHRGGYNRNCFVKEISHDYHVFIDVI